MRISLILPLASIATAFVVPDASVFEQLAIEPRQRQSPIQATWDNVKDSASSVKDSAASVLDNALDKAQHLENDVATPASDAISWGQDKTQDAWKMIENFNKEHHGPRHPHAPPEDDPHHGPPCHPKPPHHGPHHPHVDSNKTVYQLIAVSKYTTKLANLINDFPDLVEKLNGTAANYTVFAPTDKAFDKIPDHHPKPDRETLEKILSYHVSPQFYPAGRVLNTHTIPTLLQGHHLASEPKPQRLSINIGLKGLTVNFYSRIVAIDIFASNGVIHGIDSLLVPPPNIIEIIDLLPSEFSTLELALSKTGLLDTLNSTHHPGGTFFAPSNFAFKKLGPKINMFLFSKHGQKYLKALLLYHIGTGTTLYSDAAYVSDDKDTISSISGPISSLGGGEHEPHHDPHHGDGDHKPHTPKGYHHYDLPTMLHDQKLNVDVIRYGPYIGMKVNGFSRVVVQDGIAQDGVIQVVGDVLVPPHGDRMAHARRRGGVKGWARAPVRKMREMFGMQRTMSLCEFKARFKGLVEE